MSGKPRDTTDPDWRSSKQWAASHPMCSASPSRSTAPAPAVPSWQISTSHRSCCEVSSCSLYAPASSGSSLKRYGPRWHRKSSTRSKAEQNSSRHPQAERWHGDRPRPEPPSPIGRSPPGGSTSCSATFRGDGQCLAEAERRGRQRAAVPREPPPSLTGPGPSPQRTQLQQTRQNHPHWHGANIRPSQFRTEPESQVVRRRRAPHRDAVRQAVTLRSGGFPGRK